MLGDRRVLAVIVACASVWVVFRLWTGIVLEDALITFRHAENLAAGQGYGFNPGEWVQGSTTPLLTLLLAGVAVIAGPGAIPAAAVVLGLAAALLAAALSADILRRWGCSPPVQALAVGGWMLGPRVVWSGVGGMETPLVAAWMALSLWAAERRDGATLGAALALLVLTRPDGVLWASLTLAVSAHLWRRAWPFLLPVLAWAVFATWAFGTPVPHAILAKSVVNPRAGALFSAHALGDRLVWTSEALAAPFPAVPVVGWALVVGGLALSIRAGGTPAPTDGTGPRVPTWLVPATFLVAMPALLHLGRAPNFYWYPVPVALAAALVGGFAADALARRVNERVGWAVVALALVGSAVHLLPVAKESWEVQQNEERMRAEVGRWIDRHAPPDASVAMEAIGYQGTSSRRRVVDLAGLVSPAIVAIAREQPENADRFARMLEAERPWAVVLRSWEVPRNRHFHGGPLFPDEAARARFLTDYAEGARFTAPFPERMGRNHDVVVYVRSDDGR